MSAQNDVAEDFDLPDEGEVWNFKTLTVAVSEVGNFLAATSVSIGLICTSIETASDKELLRQGFRLNECVRMLHVAIPCILPPQFCRLEFQDKSEGFPLVILLCMI